MSDPETSEEVTIERAIEILLAQVENLHDRLCRLESLVTTPPPVATVASASQQPSSVGGATRPLPVRYHADPFHGLFGHYFVLGILLLAVLGVVLALASSESINLVWWGSAISLTLYQLVFVVLGALLQDRHTLMNATVGLTLAVLIDIGVVRLVPFPFMMGT